MGGSHSHDSAENRGCFVMGGGEAAEGTSFWTRQSDGSLGNLIEQAVLVSFCRGANSYSRFLKGSRVAAILGVRPGH